MKSLYIILLLILMSVLNAFAAETLHGKIFSIDEKGDTVALSYAGIYWEKTNINTQSDKDGNFNIIKPLTGDHKLIVSYVGFKSDTLVIAPEQKHLAVLMHSNGELATVTITKQTEGTYFSALKPIKTEIISQAGLQKLACCNLSESFQNNASVDVGYADAVTGARQIQMLGLSGIYSQLLFENLPSMRGLAVSNSMSYVPGSWMESIQISKGTSSVLNGYESVTGQINIEFKKPTDAPILFVNLYGGDNSRLELNANTVILNKGNWQSMLMTHVSGNFNKMDENGDSFLEMPLGKQVNLYNRWKYTSNNQRIEQQFGLRYLNDNKLGGNMHFKNKSDLLSGIYGFSTDINNLQVYTKSGYLINPEKGNSIALFGSYSAYSNKSFFGFNDYSGLQHSLSYNLIYESQLISSNHKLSSGLSINYDNIQQSFNDSAFNETEYVPGFLSQYTWIPNIKTSAIIGVRLDYHSRYGWYLVPRAHIKYEPLWSIVFRASIGRGLHSSNVLAENMNLLASSRKWYFIDQPELERAWNSGINVTKTFKLSGNRSIQWSADFYKTIFDNQVMVDIDSDPQSVHVYNLVGKSYSNAFQTDLIAQPFKGIEITAAYRMNDVQQTLHGELMNRPFVIKHRGVVSASYATKFKKWQFDVTSQFNGSAHLPNTQSNPLEFRVQDMSPSYINLIAQITRRFKHFDVYAGGENLTNYVQKNSILAASAPFGKYFDASMVWGPVSGRMFYGGLRYTLN